jgi:predicted XRE-type DNA-binding protein
MSKLIKTTNFQDFCETMGVDYQVMKIKSNLVEKIKLECRKKKISQRALAKKVPGLTHDRVSKIFNDQIGHMTIDKLIQILSALKIEMKVSYKKPRAA